METAPARGRQRLAPVTPPGRGIAALPGRATTGIVRATARRAVDVAREQRFAISVYVGSRILLLVVALADSPLQHRSFASELTNWDGFWYTNLASRGYPTHVSHLQTTLGFFPFYPMVMWLVEHVTFCSYAVSGLIIAGVGGLLATVLVERLCAQWWGPQSARRAALLFCAFPGSIVFSMDYSEGVLIPLVAGCLLALRSRRWVLAGVLAGVATAVGPDAIAIVLACAVASAIELRAAGWRDASARRSLVAPLLAPVGIVAFGIFLWVWTGTPLATFRAQHYGWGERTDPLALFHQARTLASELSLKHFDYHAVNLNIIVGLAGALVLVVGVVLLLRRPRLVSPAAIAWTLGVGFLAVTSEYTPPNPRLLLTAFPAVLVIAHRTHGRSFRWVLGASTVLLVVMSAITYVGIALRP